MRLLPSIAVSVSVFAACGGSTTLGPATSGDGGTNGGDSAVVIATGTPCSVEGVTGTMPGVTISIRSAKCRYSVGEPADFTYVVTTTASLPPIQIGASQGCGDCQSPTDDPLSLVRYDIGGTSTNGTMEHYCVCDVGCCAPNQAQTLTITPATRTDVIHWSGRNWYGPSDTSNPEGAFFTPGHYEVRVSFDGGGAVASLGFDVVP